MAIVFTTGYELDKKEVHTVKELEREGDVWHLREVGLVGLARAVSWLRDCHVTRPVESGSPKLREDTLLEVETIWDRARWQRRRSLD